MGKDEDSQPLEHEQLLTLQGLFPELVVHLASFLPFRALVALSRVSTRMRWLLLAHHPKALWGPWAAKLCQDHTLDAAPESVRALLLRDPLAMLRSRLYLNSTAYGVVWLDGEHWCEVNAPSARGRVYHLKYVFWLEIRTLVRWVPRGRYRAEWRMRFASARAVDFTADWSVFALAPEHRAADVHKLDGLFGADGKLASFKQDKDQAKQLLAPWVGKGWVLVRTPAFTVADDDSTVMCYIIGGNPHSFRDLELDYTRLVPCSNQEGQLSLLLPATSR